LARHALRVGRVVDEQRLQVALGTIQAQLPAPLQALVVLMRVRYRVGRLRRLRALPVFSLAL
ncbi:hypothetical protein, partial [Paraburkholderia sp. NMBU_R16]|uniref:hypothetical protein n=1 Tax=Paraburkholderia sp. NMBU_R16 TaxID=2698676 RepID=UPI001C25FE6C